MLCSTYRYDTATSASPMENHSLPATDHFSILPPKEAQFPTHIEAAAGTVERDLVSLLSQLETCEFGIKRLVIRGDAQYALNVRRSGYVLDVEGS